ncbi:MAG: AI-2E family transporter, partial [Ilumatobacteraceae bacterium]
MDQAPGADAGPVRIQLDLRTGAWVVAVVLAALTLIALISNTTVVLTQIGIGVIVALALDPLTDAFQRRWHLPRVLTVAMIVIALLVLAGLLAIVLGPRAVEEAGKFSEQLPRTLREIEDLPLIGGWARDNDFAQRVLDWVAQLPQQFTDERIADVASSLVSGVVAITVVSIVTIAALIDGEEFVNRARRLIPIPHRPRADQVGRVMYHTIG